jgi:hypothetical protein
MHTHTHTHTHTHIEWDTEITSIIQKNTRINQIVDIYSYLFSLIQKHSQNIVKNESMAELQ